MTRYCARPSFASDRLVGPDDSLLDYRVKQFPADGRTSLSLTPLELLSRLAALIPPPRQHRTLCLGPAASAELRRIAPGLSLLRGSDADRCLRDRGVRRDPDTAHHCAAVIS